jgi:magnesium-transporting ATPase (P-type)
MDEFAGQGLRTLMFGQKILSPDLTKESMKETTAEELEGDIELLGVTALEDLLQDNVAKCIK